MTVTAECDWKGALPRWIPQAASRLPDWSSPDDRGIRNMRIKIGDKSGLGAVPGRLTGEGVTCCSEKEARFGNSHRLADQSSYKAMEIFEDYH